MSAKYHYLGKNEKIQVMTKTFPFRFTSPVIRYLEVMINQYNNRSRNIADKSKVTPFNCEIDTYNESEPYMTDSEENRISFLNYLVKKKALDFEENKEKGFKLYEDDVVSFRDKDSLLFFKAAGIEYPVHFRVIVTDIAPILNIWGHYNSGVKTELTNSFSYDKDSDFAYDKVNKRIRYLDKIYTFQKRTKGVTDKICVFEFLWSKRRHLYKGKVVPELPGTPVSKQELIKEIKNKTGVTLSPLKLSELLKNLGFALKRKSIPINIKYTDDSVLVTTEEKV